MIIIFVLVVWNSPLVSLSNTIRPVQIIGPICVKSAITRAGEIGKALGTIDDWATEGPD